MTKAKVTVYIDSDIADQLRQAAMESGAAQGDIIGAALVTALGRRGRRGDPLRALDRGPVGALALGRSLRGQGRMLREIAEALNADGFTTKQNKRWSTVSVSRLLSR